MSIDIGDLYNQYLGQGLDKKTAAQYAAFQYIANPTGSIKGIKQPPKWYSQDQWIDYSAPDYRSLVSYQGSDPFSLYVKGEVSNRTKGGKRLTLQDASEIATGAATKGYTGEAKLSTGDVYNQVKDVVLQYESALKNYEQQKNTHVYSQYGLDPNQRYVIDPKKATTDKQFIVYQPAADYVKMKTKSVYDNLIKQGYSIPDVEKYAQQYSVQLTDTLQKKLDDSALTPFIDRVNQLRKASGKGK